MPPAPSDEVLLASAHAADFEMFYRRHLDLVTAYVTRRAGSPDLTVDLVAETFARALTARRRYDADRGPGIAWLLWIARNLLIDTARRGRVASDARERLRMEPVVLDDDGYRRVEERAAFDVDALLESLPPDQREVVRRRVIDEEPYVLVADHVGCSEQLVRQRLSRGLATLRRTVERP
ncbi:sigma-70 family RNA polymerase sigma factor [Patulibacter sp. NPDC049589]|uniref:RNA polymerase sigma factor n=1 Tax=Patulibacter sp. NPDC049589 TaxID=3154731 RepID=UPI003448E48A